MLVRPRFLPAALGPLALAACGTIGSIEGASGSSGTLPDDAAGSLETDTSANDAATGDEATTDAGTDACVANGSLALDPTFPPKTIPAVQIRATPAPNGRYAVVGRSACGDSGFGVELRFLEANGDPTPDRVSCFADGIELVESMATRPGGGWEVGSSVGAGIYTATLRTLGPTGAVLGTKTRSGFHHLALPLGAATVWGGYRETPSPDGTAFFGFAGGTIVEIPSERVVGAVARGSDVFALVVTNASPAAPTITLRKYVGGGALTEDVAVRSSVVTLASPTTSFSFDGLGSMIVEGTKVTAALPVPGAIAIYEYVEGAGWSPKGSVASLANPASLLRSCDGSLLLSYVSNGSGHRIARFVVGNPSPTSDLVLSTSASTRTMLRDPVGRVVVFQTTSGGQSAVVRVNP